MAAFNKKCSGQILKRSDGYLNWSSRRWKYKSLNSGSDRSWRRKTLTAHYYFANVQVCCGFNLLPEFHSLCGKLVLNKGNWWKEGFQNTTNSFLVSTFKKSKYLRWHHVPQKRRRGVHPRPRTKYVHSAEDLIHHSTKYDILQFQIISSLTQP